MKSDEFCNIEITSKNIKHSSVNKNNPTSCNKSAFPHNHLHKIKKGDTSKQCQQRLSYNNNNNNNNNIQYLYSAL